MPFLALPRKEVFSFSKGLKLPKPIEIPF